MKENQKALTGEGTAPHDKRNAFVAKYGVIGGTLESRAASHSTLLLSKDERQAQDDGRSNFGSDWPYRDLKRKYVRAVNNAEALAKRVSRLIDLLSHSDVKLTPWGKSEVANARADLTKWEADQ